MYVCVYIYWRMQPTRTHTQKKRKDQQQQQKTTASILARKRWKKLLLLDFAIWSFFFLWRVLKKLSGSRMKGMKKTESEVVEMCT